MHANRALSVAAPEDSSIEAIWIFGVMRVRIAKVPPFSVCLKVLSPLHARYRVSRSRSDISEPIPPPVTTESGGAVVYYTKHTDRIALPPCISSRTFKGTSHW
jgi:hypothetical protein